jgi:hypothetical protein
MTIPSTRRRLSVYDGRLWLGDFVWNEKTQQALTWDASRRFIGQFGSYRAAARAIGQHAAAKRQAAGALHRLDDPSPPFVTGPSRAFFEARLMAQRMLTAGTGRAPFAERGEDLYEAPPVAVHALLRFEALPDVICGPACGPDNIVKTLRGGGYRVYPFANSLPMMRRDGWDQGPQRNGVRVVRVGRGAPRRAEAQRMNWEPVTCG